MEATMRRSEAPPAAAASATGPQPLVRPPFPLDERLVSLRPLSSLEADQYRMLRCELDYLLKERGLASLGTEMQPVPWTNAVPWSDRSPTGERRARPAESCLA